MFAKKKRTDFKLIYFSVEVLKIKHYILKREPKKSGRLHQVLKLSIPAKKQKGSCNVSSCFFEEL